MKENYTCILITNLGLRKICKKGNATKSLQIPNEKSAKLRLKYDGVLQMKNKDTEWNQKLSTFLWILELLNFISLNISFYHFFLAAWVIPYKPLLLPALQTEQKLCCINLTTYIFALEFYHNRYLTIFPLKQNTLIFFFYQQCI